MTATKTNGDTIADQVKHHQSTDTNISDVAHSLTDAHAHRPGLWQQDLAKANDALHKQGLLPGVDVVGMRGQDMVTRDQQTGKVQLVDSTNTASRHNAGFNGPRQDASTDVGGRHATTNTDGSGTVTAKSGDNSPWVLSQAVLKSQGIDNPSPNQMANYQMELEKANGKKVGQFKPGDDIKIPPFTTAGDKTDFVGDRAGAQATKEKADVDKQYDEASAALKKFAGGGVNLGITDSRNMNRDDINTALQRTDLTDADKRGLQFLSQNYDKLATSGGIYRSGVWGSSLDKAKTAAEAQVQNKLASAIGYDI